MILRPPSSTPPSPATLGVVGAPPTRSAPSTPHVVGVQGLAVDIASQSKLVRPVAEGQSQTAWD